ncbi:MAG: class I SAM-dependent methyltransferase [Ruminococcus sp.]|nr:class I SAM-dependent methyltransferase [Ruminococcus sp.]
MGYSVFAYHYDSLTANIDYRKRAKYFDKIINKFKRTDGNVLLDLACGTGSISEQMALLGYDVIGVDNSEEMLGIALDKKFNSGLNIQYLCQDMRKLDMFGSMDITICALDSINHLANISDVKKVFENIALFSEPDALFIFDINTLYKHRNILANNTFTYETENVFCIWENTLIPETDEVKMNLEFFELEDNGLYSRTSDCFSEKAYSEEQIENLLINTGFEIIGKYGDDTLFPPEPDCQRIVYVARCINSGQIN